eukprot:8273571-Alexandrium_andersonii.AAC.1
MSHLLGSDCSTAVGTPFVEQKLARGRGVHRPVSTYFPCVNLRSRLNVRSQGSAMMKSVQALGA